MSAPTQKNKYANAHLVSEINIFLRLPYTKYTFRVIKAIMSWVRFGPCPYAHFWTNVNKTPPLGGHSSRAAGSFGNPVCVFVYVFVLVSWPFLTLPSLLRVPFHKFSASISIKTKSKMFNLLTRLRNMLTSLNHVSFFYPEWAARTDTPLQKNTPI